MPPQTHASWYRMVLAPWVPGGLTLLSGHLSFLPLGGPKASVLSVGTEKQSPVLTHGCPLLSTSLTAQYLETLPEQPNMQPSRVSSNSGSEDHGTGSLKVARSDATNKDGDYRNRKAVPKGKMNKLNSVHTRA